MIIDYTMSPVLDQYDKKLALSTGLILPKSTIKIVETLVINSFMHFVIHITVQAKLLYSLISKGFY